MSNYIRLTKILLKNGFGKSLSKSTATKKKTGQTLLYIIVAIALLPMFFLFYTMANAVYDSLVMLGQQGLVLTLGFWTTSMVIFFFGFFYVINVFYFSSDIENLLPLPLRPSEILASKFTVTLIYEYLTEIFFLLPILISYGIKSGGGLPYVIFAAVIFFTLPIIPLIYSSIINMVIMRFTNLGKRKDLFRMVGGIFGIVICVGFNIVVQRLARNTASPEKMQELLLNGNNSLVKISNSIFPSNKYAALSLADANTIEGLASFGIFIALLIVFTLAFLVLGEKLYFKGVVGVSETFSRRRKLTSDEYNKTVVQSPIIKSYLLKEVKLLVRTPIYFINCVLMNFLWPIFFVIPAFAGSEEMSSFSEIFAIIRSGSYSNVILVVAFGISIFTSTTNFITSTSISREGQNIYFNKFIPVSYRDQIIAKLLSGILISMIGTTGMFIVIAVFLKLSINILLMSMMLSILAVMFTSMTGILIDLRGPKLDWDNEQKAVKQNFNSVINMLLCIVIGAASIIPLIVIRPNVFVVFAVLTGAYCILNFLLYKVVMTLGIKYFKQIEG